MTTTDYSVPNIRCEGCAETITTALSATGGVNGVRVDVTARRVIADYDESAISDTQIRRVLQEAGFPVE